VTSFNFTRDVVERLARERPRDEALRAIAADGGRRSYTFEEVAAEAARTAARFAGAGVGRGDVVMTLIGARPEWVFALLGAWRIGAVVLPGSEQLRRRDIALRIEAVRPKVALVGERNRDELAAALGSVEVAPARIVLAAMLEAGDPVAPPPLADTSLDDAALIIFTSGTVGEPRAVLHTQRYLWGQSVQAEHWLGARPGDLVWCTAASGWSKSARNTFVAPWTRGSACLLHEARFDPAERLALAAAEGVSVLCQAPTEYRMIAKRATPDLRRMPALRRLVSAGEPLNPEVIDAFQEALGLEIHDGYGQTETGQLTGMTAGAPARRGSMGRALPGFRLAVTDEEGAPVDVGELVVEPASVPTFFRGYLEGRREGEESLRAAPGVAEDPWHTGDRVRIDADGYLWFEGRLDDVILSAGYRIGPFEVESALVEHPAVAEAAAVAAPDPERGSVVRAVVVLRAGHEGNERLARELQEHVKRTTAPYKYPRLVEFRAQLPKTPSGKIRRAELRDEALDLPGSAAR
jgi:acyl-coenzyme A synthetase/AMP-(fatty) acid ligase